jgi:hypothetical protein
MNKTSQVWKILEISTTASAKLRLLVSEERVALRDQRQTGRIYRTRITHK